MKSGGTKILQLTTAVICIMLFVLTSWLPWYLCNPDTFWERVFMLVIEIPVVTFAGVAMFFAWCIVGDILKRW